MTSANSSPTKKDHTDDKFIMLPTVDVCFKLIWKYRSSNSENCRKN